MEVYDRKLARYAKHRKRMKEMRSFIIDTIDMEHEPVINDIYDVARMIQVLEAKLAPKPNWEKSMLNDRYHELRNIKRGIKHKDFLKKWRDLIVDISFAKFWVSG